MVLTRRLMGINKSPRRIDRRAGGRSKKVNLVGQLRRHYEKVLSQASLQNADPLWCSKISNKYFSKRLLG